MAILIPVEWFQVRPWYQNLRSVQTTLRRYVLPRHLTDDQIATIANYLSAHDPQEIKLIVLQNYEEAGAYRVDIQKALAGGGWKISTIDYSNNLPEGLSINFTQTMESAQSAPDPKHPKADEMLQESFRRAHIQINQTGSGSGIGVLTNSLTLSIGHRRMDDEDLIVKKQNMEMLRKMVEQGGDEDTFR